MYGNTGQVSSTYEQMELVSSIEGCNAHQLIDLLYKGATAKIAKAKCHISNRQFGKKGEEISKVIAIINELRDCLPANSEEPIAQNLDALYRYLVQIISEANLSNNIDKLDEAAKLLLSLRETWNMIPEDARY